LKGTPQEAAASVVDATDTVVAEQASDGGLGGFQDILGYLKANAGESFSRSEILENTGISAEGWNTIRPVLTETRGIQTTGHKKSTKYSWGVPDAKAAVKEKAAKTAERATVANVQTPDSSDSRLPPSVTDTTRVQIEVEAKRLGFRVQKLVEALIILTRIPGYKVGNAATEKAATKGAFFAVKNGKNQTPKSVEGILRLGKTDAIKAFVSHIRKHENSATKAVPGYDMPWTEKDRAIAKMAVSWGAAMAVVKVEAEQPAQANDWF